ETLIEMLERAGAARGDHGDRDALRHRARELEVVAVLGSVAVHARHGALTGAERDGLARPVERVAPGRATSAVGVDAPARRLVGPSRLAPGVDRHDDALAAEALDGFADHRRALEGGGVQRDLVGSGAEQAPHVVDRADAATDGE